MASTPYIYSALPCCNSGPGEQHICSYIRVLKVTVNSEDEIFGTLKIRKLDHQNANTYHCLSYTWGNPLAPVTSSSPPLKQSGHNSGVSDDRIVCDGQVIEIGQNLADGLRTLFKYRKTELNDIWVDQICINQTASSDKAEKNSQVRIMHTIYENAKSVLVWLGRADTVEENMSSTLQLARDLSEYERLHPEITQDREDDNGRFDRFKYELAARYSHRDWIYARNFLRRSYFQRMWIFQEIICAQRIIAYCGHTEWTWNEIHNLSQAFSSFGYEIMSHDPSIEPWAQPVLCHNPHHTGRWKQQFRSAPNQTGLYSSFSGLVLMANRGKYLCSDPRDVIYSHLGICRRTDISVDYTRPVEDIYTEFWERYITVDVGGITINSLGLIEDHDGTNHMRALKNHSILHNGHTMIVRRPTLPSWVPDLQTARTSLPLSLHYWSLTERNDGRLWFYASGLPPNELPLDIYNLKPQETEPQSKVTFEIKDRELIISGHCIGVVNATSECKSFTLHGGTPLQDLLPRMLEIIIATLLDAAGSSEDRVLSLLETMVTWSQAAGTGETEVQILNDIDSVKDKFKQWLLYVLSHPEVMQITDHGLDTQRQTLYQLLGVQPELASVLPSQQEVADYTNGYTGREALNFGDAALRCHRIFTVQNGSLSKKFMLGKGPSTLAIGDEIWIFPGARVPFVLRQAGPPNHYRIYVGHAFVHGVMQGQLVDELKLQLPKTVHII